MASLIPPLEHKSVKARLSDLRSAIKEAGSHTEKSSIITSHLEATKNDPLFQLDPEFPSPVDWFNSPPLSFANELKGKIVVLDFFTYCCVNCMHILPDLEELERRYPPKEGVVVVGVHSAKFGNEKVSANIHNAIERYGIKHPVVNDTSIELWERLGVTCWPTLVIIGPDRQLLHYIIGEGHAEELFVVMETAVEFYKDERSRADIPVGGPLREAVGGGVLKYPGKLCFDEERGTLFIADSSNNRILCVEEKSGRVTCVFGSGVAGLKDGNNVECQFSTPQGMVCHQGVLYIADTNNHALRKVDLEACSVTTIAGTGCQGNDKEGGAVGVAQEISSPWDLELGKSPNADHPNILFIAMAGTHQIWIHCLEEVDWTKGRHYPAGTTLRFSGSGDEANKNNSYPHKAAFAQPSGITLGGGGASLYIADSESSTVRCVSVPEGGAKALVGGAIDPTDLFAYGDKDGKGRDARLQHPLGVVWNQQDNLLYVADSYNHKIKVISTASKHCTTLAGTGAPGLVSGDTEHAQFSEPGGLCLGPEGKSLFIADTNNHAIRVLDLDTKQVTEFKVFLSETSSSAAPKRLTGKRAINVTFDPVTVPEKGVVTIAIRFALPTGCHWTENAPSAWQLLTVNSSLFSLASDALTTGPLSTEATIKVNTHFNGSANQMTAEFQVEAVCYFCEESGVCHMQGAVLTIPLICAESCEAEITKSLTYQPAMK